MLAEIQELTRRRLLELGCGGYFGLNLGGLIQRQALSASKTNSKQGLPPIRSCIFLFFYGGASHLETFDLKPNGPSEIRGEFQPISTRVPGFQISEYLPRLAQLTDHIGVVRSMHHQAHLHDSASIHMLTGRPLDGPDRELFAPLPQVYPSYGGAVAYLYRAQRHDVPFTSLPFEFHNVVPTPCQGGGFLGTAYDPLRIEVNPTGRKYVAEVLRPAEGLNQIRFQGRRNLLATLDETWPDKIDRQGGTLRGFYETAYRILESETIAKAVDITEETPETRERYGFLPSSLSGEMGYAQAMRGQNLLLARRLVEAGVPFVNVYDFRQQGQNWDAHSKCCEQHKTHLLPQIDIGLSALIVDLKDRGLLDSTLIVATGEFGRTPKINGNAGRDHWPECYSVLLAGGGVRGGAIYGSSDPMGAFPATDPATPADLAATIFWRFGLDPATEIIDQTGRPHRLAAGEPITRLFS